MNLSDYQNFEDLILDETFHEYVTGSSEASVLFWNDWIANHPEKKAEVQKAGNVIKTLVNNRKKEVTVDKNESLARLLNQIENDTQSNNSRTLIPSWLKIAALVLISTGMGWVANWSYKSMIKHDTLVFNEIIVPIGEKSQVILSDGTYVWINSGSKFKYPVSFGKQSREVYLTGEAFFDVKKRQKQSFVVNTSDARVKVLGTAFNVKAYPEDAKTQTTVVHGLVSVQNLRKKEQEVLIKPNQMAVLKRNIAAVVVSNTAKPAEELQVIKDINVEALTCWKNQLLVFADEPLGDMALKMERWFNIRISIEDSTLRQERYNGKFVHNETIYEVLEAIKQTTPIKYTVNENRILIARK